MAEVKPRNYIIGMLLFGLVISLIISMFTQVGSDLQGNTDEFNTTFNHLSEIQEETDAYTSNLEEAQASEGTLGFLNSLINTAWVTMRTMLGSFSFMGTALQGATGFFGIPPVVIGTLLSIIAVIIVFAILRSILQSGEL